MGVNGQHALQEATMPFVHIKVSGPSLSAPKAARLRERATELMEQVMRKKFALTVVAVEQSPPGSWSVGGQQVGAAAFMEVKVTQGTNTAQEKSRFIAEAMNMLREVIGPELDPVAYVVVHEVPAEAWGYDGFTQAHRAQLSAAA